MILIPAVLALAAIALFVIGLVQDSVGFLFGAAGCAAAAGIAVMVIGAIRKQMEAAAAARAAQSGAALPGAVVPAPAPAVPVAPPAPVVAVQPGAGVTPILLPAGTPPPPGYVAYVPVVPQPAGSSQSA